MARKLRLHFPGALYHVVTRGNNRQDIFLVPGDYQTFLKYLAKIKKETPFLLYAYCLMPNHVHFFIEVAQTPLSVIMQRLLTSYTVYFNGRHDRKGHLFQGRYKAFLCQKDVYLFKLVRYIHLNPVRAGLVKTPAEWKWSGHLAYIEERQGTFLDTVFILSQLSPDPSRSRQQYRELLGSEKPDVHRKDYYPENKRPYLGDENFQREIAARGLMREAQLTPVVKREPISLPVLIGMIAERAKLSNQMIQSNSRSSAIAQARSNFIIEAISQGHKAADIARYIGCSPSYISKVLTNQEREKVSEVSEA